MKFIVCVKQVPNTAGKVAVKEDGTMDRWQPSSTPTT